MTQTTAEYAISRAKAQLLLDAPFYASLACNLEFREDNTIPTLAVDGKHVFFNSEYVNTLTNNQLKFAVAHEVMHCVLHHLTRRGARDPLRWNQAADYVINDMLVTDNVGEIHPDWLHNDALVKAGDYSADRVYNLLPEDEGNGKGNGHGSPQDIHIENKGGSSEAEENEANWTLRAVQAAQAAKVMGRMSAGAQRFIDEIVNPKVNWRELLQRFVSKRVKTDRSFSKPNRRFLSQGVYMPSMSGETLGDIAIAVDCSGSIDIKTLNEFAGEIAGIKNTMRPAKIHVLYFDSEVSHTEEYGPEDELDIRPHGGGGTAFSPVFDKIEALGIEPECCVFLTDLYCSDFGSPPDYPVLWCTNGATEAPFGEIAQIK